MLAVGSANEGGTLTLTNSTIVENHGTGTLGGAGLSSSGGKTTIINSTISGNVTNNYGGGILSAYGSVVTLIHSTVSGNTANQNFADEPWGSGGGVYIIDAEVQIHNSIIAGNTDMTDPADHTRQTDVGGAFTSLGGNLIGDGTGSTGWVATDLVGDATTPVNPMLAALALNAPGNSRHLRPA